MTSNYSLNLVPAGLLNYWALFKDYMGVNHIYELFKLGVLFPCRNSAADLKHRMRGVWRDTELVDPNTHNNKLATDNSWLAIPSSSNECTPTIEPRILHPGLSKHVMRNVYRLRLRTHTLKEEAAVWLEGGCSPRDQRPPW